MIRLMRFLKWFDFISIIAIIGLTVFQVYCTMSLTDYVRDIVAAIVEQGTRIQMGLSSDVSEIWRCAGMMILFSALSALTQIVISVMASGLSAGLAKNIRAAENAKIIAFSQEEMRKFSPASLITRTTNDIQQVQFTFVFGLRLLFSAPITAIWAIIKIGTVAWNLTAVPAVGLSIIVCALALLMTVVMPRFRKTQKLLDRVNLITKENLEGIRVVRAYNAEGYQNEKFEEANNDLTRVQLFTGRAMALLSPVMMIVMNGVTLGIYWLGAVLINAKELDYATMTSFMMLSTQIIMSFVMLLLMFIMLPRAQVCAKRINEVLSSKSRIEDSDKDVTFSEVGTIEFKDVTFTYPDADSPVLSHISFKAKPGDTVAFIGSTGSGKSTIISLAARLYDATEGEVIINGVNVKDIPFRSLRKQIALTPQKGFLFSGTVKSNIAFADPSLSDTVIRESAEIACADEFIAQMDGGYEAKIAQGGTNVSGGQRQRLCIARTLASGAPIACFDDSFSALDFKTDKQVRSNIAKKKSSLTKLIVAARIGTIMDADQIVVLSEGACVGVGTHKELLKTCEVYREIALSQLSKEELGL